MVTIIEGITEPNCFMGVNFYQIYSVGEDCSFILFELVFVVGDLAFGALRFDRGIVSNLVVSVCVCL